MIDGLFRTYRPELHDMRGPGSKWHAKHGVRIGQTVFVDGGCRGAIAAPARRTIKLQDRRAKWKRASPMLQILTLVLAMLVNPATAARTETSYCGRYLAAARLRWAPTLTNPLIGFSCASEPARLEQVVTRAPGPPDMVRKGDQQEPYLPRQQASTGLKRISVSTSQPSLAQFWVTACLIELVLELLNRDDRDRLIIRRPIRR